MTTTDVDEAPQFGHVSRRVGIAFRYLLAASTLVGIVSLALLLVYVANDAFQPTTADTGWLVTVAATVVGPTALVGIALSWYRRQAFLAGLAVVGLAVVSLLFAAGLSAIFIDVVPPLVWFAYCLGVLAPVVVGIALTYLDWQVPFLARVLVVGGAGFLAVFGIPPFVPGIPGIYSLVEQVLRLPYVPADWLIMTLTVGGPIGLIVWRTARRWGDRPGLLGGAGSILVVAVAGLGAPAIGVGVVPATVVTALAIIPTGVYVLGILIDRPPARVGLLFPAVLVAGIGLASITVAAFGFAGPQTWLDWAFVTGTDQASLGTPETAGIYPAIVGTILLMVVVALLSFPLGVGAAVYLEEYAPDSRFKRIVDVNIANLAGVPSVVYGLLGLGVFVRYGGMTPGTVLVGGATLSLLILPIVIIAAREAIRAVPDSMREASYGMGATEWQTVRTVVLPEAFPGILTGTILALGRAIGETAPLLVIGAPQIFGLPASLDAPVGALPLQLYVWATTFASEAFWTTALAAGVVTLLVAMLTMNSIAIVLRNRYQGDRQP